MTTFVDTNILVRHLTSDPPAMARRATAFLAAADDLLLPDLIVAEVVYALESYYGTPRPQIAQAVRSLLGFEAVTVRDAELLHRSIEVYELHGLDFADAYLVADAEIYGADLASFDRGIDAVGTVTRVEPSES